MIKQTNETGPLISIIMPVYNDAQRLERCLKSLLAQTVKNFEVIIVNDGSTDSTPEILNEYSSNDKRLIILNANRIGPYGCRNIGLRNARGKYIGFIDSDDWVKPETYKEMISALEISGSDSIICSSSRFDESTGKYSNHFDYTNWPENFRISSENIHKINGATWNKIYKTDNIRKLDLRFSEYRMTADVLFNWIYFLSFPQVSVISEAFYIYTFRGESIVTKSHGIKSLDMIRVMRDLKMYLKSKNRFQDYKDSYYELVAKSVGRRFMREGWSKLIFLIMTLVWIGPGLFSWGLSHFNEFSDKIKQH